MERRNGIAGRLIRVSRQRRSFVGFASAELSSLPPNPMSPHVSPVGSHTEGNLSAHIMKVAWEEGSGYRVSLSDDSDWSILGPLKEDDLARVLSLLEWAQNFIETRWDEYGEEELEEVSDREALGTLSIPQTL